MDHQGLFQDWHALLYSTYMDYHLNSALLDSPPLDYWARCRDHACLFADWKKIISTCATADTFKFAS